MSSGPERFQQLPFRKYQALGNDYLGSDGAFCGDPFTSLVLLPGLDGTGRLFKPFVDAVGSGAPVTVVDYASPELSRYEDCRAVAERNLPQDEPYVLVGESFSGPIAVSIAASRPPGLRGLVLVASFVSSPRWLLKLLSPVISVLPTRGSTDWFADLVLMGRYATPELRTLRREVVRGVSPGVIRDRLREVAHVDVTRELAAVDVQCAPRECARLLLEFASQTAPSSPGPLEKTP